MQVYTSVERTTYEHAIISSAPATCGQATIHSRREATYAPGPERLQVQASALARCALHGVHLKALASAESTPHGAPLS